MSDRDRIHILLTPHPWNPGVDALGAYGEHFWLPILGPTAYLIVRRFDYERLQQAKQELWSDEVTFYLEDLAIDVGTAGKTVRNAIKRLAGYHLIHRDVPDGPWAVPVGLPRLGLKQLRRLPDDLQKLEGDFWRQLQA